MGAFCFRNKNKHCNVIACYDSSALPTLTVLSAGLFNFSYPKLFCFGYFSVLLSPKLIKTKRNKEVLTS